MKTFLQIIRNNWRTSLMGLLLIGYSNFGYFELKDLSTSMCILFNITGMGLLLADDGKSLSQKLRNYGAIVKQFYGQQPEDNSTIR